MLIIVFSSSSIVPFSSPTSTIILISSSVTVSSSFSETPKIFETIFVEKVKNLTNGDITIEIALITPIDPYAIFSLYFIAIRFGTSSPKINVKYDKIIVIIIIATLFHAPKLIAGIQLYRIGDNSPANLSAANALDKNPANVIPICIVAKNLLGFSSILFIFLAFLFPSFASISTFASFKEINAISLAAKNAFIKTSIIKIKISSMFVSPIVLFFSFYHKIIKIHSVF